MQPQPTYNASSFVVSLLSPRFVFDICFSYDRTRTSVTARLAASRVSPVTDECIRYFLQCCKLGFRAGLLQNAPVSDNLMGIDWKCGRE